MPSDTCAFVDCPPGLFRFQGMLCFKSEYSTKAGQPDAYCVDSGEYFWGGTQGDLKARRALIVRPIATPTASEATAIGAGEPLGAMLICDQTGGRIFTAWPVTQWPEMDAKNLYGDRGGYRTVPLYAAAAVSEDDREEARNMLDARGIGPDTLHGTWVGHDDVVEVVADALSLRATAAPPKVASDTAPGVEHARNIADGMAEACATLAVSTKYDAEDRQRWKACHDDAAAISAALAASPTASDTDTAIPGGGGLSERALHWRLMGLAATLRSEEFDEDSSSALDVEEAARRLAASPKPDTDTPVDPGVEGLRTSAALALMYLQTGFIACDACGHEMPTKDLDATSELSEALAAKPIAGMDAEES